MEKRTNGLGIASMIIGIIALLLSCCYGGWLGIVGLILGIIGINKADTKKATSLVGIITSSVAILISLVMTMAGIPGVELPDTDSESTENVSTESVISTDTELITEDITTEEITTEATSTEEQVSTETAIPEISEDEFRAGCEAVNYKDLLRNPDDYMGKDITITLKVSQTGIPGGFLDSNEYIRCYSNDEYNMWLGDVYVLVDGRTTDNSKILVDDVITVYGTFDGLQEFQLALTGTTEEYPIIIIKYLDLIEA